MVALEGFVKIKRHKIWCSWLEGSLRTHHYDLRLDSPGSGKPEASNFRACRAAWPGS